MILNSNLESSNFQFKSLEIILTKLIKAHNNHIFVHKAILRTLGDFTLLPEVFPCEKET